MILFISIAIHFEKHFDLFYLRSLPTIHESEFVTIIPDIKYYLKTQETEIIPLNDTFTLGKTYQCPN